jgi:hypothetical protein
MENVLPELKKGDVLARSINGASETLTVRQVGEGKEFDEPVYFLVGKYGVKLKTAYTIEQLAGMGFKLTTE